MADPDEENIQVGERSETQLGCVKQIELLKGKAWFFLDISYEQIQLILGLKEENTFLVTNGAFYDQFVLYMSIKSLTDNIQLVKIDQKHCDDGFKYMVEGKEELHASVIEAVDSFTSSSEFTLVPAVENARQESLRSQDSCDIDIDTPPNYTAAATFPGVIHSLPTVTTKVDTLKGEDADDVEAPPTPHAMDNTINRVRRNAIRNRNRSSAVQQAPTARERCEHCCAQSWDFCCHAGRDELENDRRWYDFRGAGPCRCILVFMFWFCVVLFCCPFACCYLCFFIYGALNFVLCDDS